MNESSGEHRGDMSGDGPNPQFYPAADDAELAEVAVSDPASDSGEAEQDAEVVPDGGSVRDQVNE